MGMSTEGPGKSKVPLTPGKKQPQLLALCVLTVVVDVHDLSQVYSVPVASAVHLSVCPHLPVTHQIHKGLLAGTYPMPNTQASHAHRDKRVTGYHTERLEWGEGAATAGEQIPTGHLRGR